jgi:hypothetical protein
MAKFTREQWHQALCDVHVTNYVSGSEASIYWCKNHFEIGSKQSRNSGHIWTMSTTIPRPTYEEALLIVDKIG